MCRILALLLSLPLLASLTLIPAAADESRGIPTTDDLQADARLAASSGRPILLMVSQAHCPYCDLMKREVLHPMTLGGDYLERILIREILIDSTAKIIDFQGRRSSAAAFARGYGANFTPTLLFLDPQGRELTERIVGINTVELFSFYLDAAIDKVAPPAAETVN